jgi:ABC-2 type transport system permease protein
VTVIAKTTSSALLATFQAVLLFPLIWILGLHPSATAIVELVGAIVLSSITLSSLGMLIASRLRSLENFATLMNFVMFPMFFLSTALYPAATLPGFLRPLVRINPLTYAIDLMRHTLLAGQYTGNLGSDYNATFDIAVLVVTAIVLLALAMMLFGEEDHLASILLTDEPGRRRSPPRLRAVIKQRA